MSTNNKSKISEMEQVNVVTEDMLLSVIQDGKNKKITYQKFMENIVAGIVNGGEVENNHLLLTRDGQTIIGPIGPFVTGTGSGGSSSNGAVMKATNTSGWLSKTISLGNDCYIDFEWSSLEDDIPTGAGTLKIKVNESWKSPKNIAQGAVSINVKDYVSAGTNTIKVNISDVYGNSRTINYTVFAVVLTLESPFDWTVPYSGTIKFPYTPTGNVDKTMHFILDGEEIGTEIVTTSGIQKTYTIPAQTHGTHTWLAYFTAEIDGEVICSNELYFELMCTVDGIVSTVIASDFRETKAVQFETLTINYVVYTPLKMTSAVTLLENDTAVSELTVDRTLQTWSYRPDDAGDLVLKIATGDAEKPFYLTVEESEIDVEAETEDLVFYLSSYGRSNNETDPGIWESGDVSVAFNDFNFVTDGWQLDEDGITVMRIGGDARLDIPYQIFANDFRTTGKTIEIEFATRDVLDYDAVILSCMSGGRGLEVTARTVALASEQSSAGTKYKEKEHNRIAFVIEKRSRNKFLLCYINGVISGITPYADDDDFSQIVPVNITVGSNECTTDIYNIRIYDNDLTRYQMLDNWIADTQDAVLKNERYANNNIYDAYGQITIDTLKKDVPYMVIVCPVLPQYKGDKKTCSGYYIDPVHPERSFWFEDAVIDVQGTSSQYYWIKNIKAKFKGGFTNSDGVASETYAMSENAYPTDTFTCKADVASLEGYFNVISADFFNELCPVKTPAQEEDARIRQTIEGHPIVIFWDYGNGPTFYGKFNFNNDKGTPEVFGFEDGDESWEILQNGTDRVAFKSADFSGDGWKADFEARYPEDNTDITRLAAFAAWIASTDTDAATDEPLDAAITYNGVAYTTDSAEYRLAKFVAELADHASVKHSVFYYTFTLFFLCIDQREKNGFPTWIAKMALWMWLYYDGDSIFGTDNKGKLTFDYWMEDIDYTDAGEPVFNGQNSVFWKNIRNGFWDEVLEEYTRWRTELRDDGRPLLSYDVLMERILEHRNTWSEAIYNEDTYKKCIEPYELNGDATYLSMANGDKISYLQYWLYNRFRYFDSMAACGSSMENRILIRAHAKANVFVTSYVYMHGRVYFNAEVDTHRMMKDTEYEFVWSATGAEDAVIGINDADLITSIGDLAPLQVETIDVSGAQHLIILKLGDGAEDYVNDNLVSVATGNNTLLRLVNCMNCRKLTGIVDLSGCTGLQEAYFDNTAITGVKLPNGCAIEILHLPDTVTNVTFLNLTKLSELQLNSYDQIATLRVENTPAADTLSMLRNMVSGGRVRLVGFEWTFNDYNEVVQLVDLLDNMRGLDVNGGNTDTAEMSGIIYCASFPEELLSVISEKYPNIKIVYEELLSGYLITNKLTGAYTTNAVALIEPNTSYSTVLTTDYEYDFGAITVTMGGEDITDSVVQNVGAIGYVKIAITEVTGNVVITANSKQLSTEKPTYDIVGMPVIDLALDSYDGSGAIINNGSDGETCNATITIGEGGSVDVVDGALELTGPANFVLPLASTLYYNTPFTIFVRVDRYKFKPSYTAGTYTNNNVFIGSSQFRLSFYHNIDGFCMGLNEGYSYVNEDAVSNGLLWIGPSSNAYRCGILEDYNELAITNSGGQMRFYVNGEYLVGKNSNVTGIDITSLTFGNLSYFDKLRISKVVVYDRWLTADEIASMS